MQQQRKKHAYKESIVILLHISCIFELSCPLWLSLSFYMEFLQQVDTQSSPISWPSTLYNFSTGKYWELPSWQVPEFWLPLLTFGVWNHMILLRRIPAKLFFFLVSWWGKCCMSGSDTPFTLQFYGFTLLGIYVCVLHGCFEHKLLTENELYIIKIQPLCFHGFCFGLVCWVFF